MCTPVINRDYLLGATVGVAPHLKGYFEYLLPNPCYTVNELNTIFRYEVIRLSQRNTMAIRDWLCEANNPDRWIYYFCKHVVPWLSKRLSHVCVRPDIMIESLAG